MQCKLYTCKRHNLFKAFIREIRGNGFSIFGTKRPRDLKHKNIHTLNIRLTHNICKFSHTMYNDVISHMIHITFHIKEGIN